MSNQLVHKDEVAVGDLNSTAKGSGARKSSGKVDFTLVPWHLLAGVARVLMGGTVKYASWNWAKGMAWSVCVGCMIRHFLKWWFLRQDYDKESGEHHLDHIMCNCMFLRHYELAYPEGDDRPPKFAMFDIEKVVEWVTQPFNIEEYKRRNGLT